MDTKFMKKAAVTGATSFIAIPLIRLLLDSGILVYAIIRPKSSNKYRLPIHSNLKIIELDINDIEKLPTYILGKIDIFYHFAWEGIRGEARNNKELQLNNYHTSINSIKISLLLGSDIFIAAGSQAEYGSILNGEIKESDSEKPDTEYGKYKLLAKRDCEKYANKNHIRFIWGRIFSAYGRYDYEGSLIMSCTYKMLRNQSIDLTDCMNLWNYIYVEDVAKALYLLGEKYDVSGVYNIASEKSQILKEYVLELKEIVGSESKLIFGAISHKSEKIVQLEPNIDKIQKALEWEPEYSFRRGIQKMLDQMRS